MRTSLLGGSLLLIIGCKSESVEREPTQAPVAEVVMGAKSSGALPPRSHVSGLTPPSADLRGEPAPVPVVVCSADPTNPNGVLELAGEHYRQGLFAEANACAALATDLVPQAVEAQHLRAASLTALSRYDEAQVAFAMALVLDPDDPETLADVADFYINILPPKRRHTIQVGLEYARRGAQGAMARRSRDANLQGRLLLLEAEALNDLGDPQEALVRVEEALQIAPGLARAEHELAVCLFQLLRFKESEEVFLRLLSHAPTDAYAHHHLGLLYERKGRFADAEAHFQRAREVAPDEFRAPVIISEREFREEVDRAVAELAPELQGLLSQAEIELADLPGDADLHASDPPFAPSILGLFRGLPVGVETAPGHGPSRSLVLYRKNLGRAVRSRAELNQQIRKTLIHELGHMQGYDEDELRRRGLE